MSKIDDLKIKYQNIRPADITFFDDADTTPTKKYLDYMSKMWNSRARNYVGTRVALISAVKKFDDLLPYIENKDIYSPIYLKFTVLLYTIQTAEILRDDKLFVKEDHIVVIHETPTYLLLFPKTFKGSCKYGANTKWCTTTSGNSTHFERYKKGYLVYLIDKTKQRSNNYEKIAFHVESDKGINRGYDIYNVMDTRIEGKYLLTAGWTEDELFDIDMYYRAFINHVRGFLKAKKEVDLIVNTMKKIDFEKLTKNLKILENPMNNNPYEEVNKVVKSFQQKMSQLNFL